MTNAALATAWPQLYQVPDATFSLYTGTETELDAHNKVRTKVCIYSPLTGDADLIEQFVKDTDCKGTTVKGYKTCLRQFAAWLDDEGITQPTRDDVRTYRDDLAARGLTAGTQAQYVRALKTFFKWLSTRGIYPNITDTVRSATVKGDAYKRDALTMDEAETVRRSIDRETLHGKMVYAMYMLGVRGGLRVIEMSRAAIKDLSEKNDVLYINIWGKGHDEPDAPKALDNDTREAIEYYLEARKHWEKSEPLFVSTSNNSKGQAITSTTISTMLKKVLVDAGFNSPRLTAHSLRHTAITTALKCSGDNIYMAQNFARHVDPATTERYTHGDKEKEDADLVRKIERKYHGEDLDKLDQASQILASLDWEQLDRAIEYLKTL